MIDFFFSPALSLEISKSGHVESGFSANPSPPTPLSFRVTWLVGFQQYTRKLGTALPVAELRQAVRIPENAILLFILLQPPQIALF